MSIKTEMRQVTPDWAGDIMDKHYERIEQRKFKQRPISISTVRKYAADMTNLAWKETPEAIIFDTDGNLINGQHRLEAVRMSKKTISMMVSTGWPAQNNGGVSLIDIVDTGRPRTIGQMLHLHGTKAASNVSATVRSIVRVAMVGNRPIMTYSNTAYILNTIGAMEWIDRIMSQSTNHRDFMARLVGPICYYYTTKPNKAMAFADAIFNFKNTTTPVQFFLRWAKNNTGLEQATYTKALASALRAHDASEEVQVIKPTLDALEWLSNTNPKLREQLRKLVPMAKS